MLLDSSVRQIAVDTQCLLGVSSCSARFDVTRHVRGGHPALRNLEAATGAAMATPTWRVMRFDPAQIVD